MENLTKKNNSIFCYGLGKEYQSEWGVAAGRFQYQEGEVTGDERRTGAKLSKLEAGGRIPGSGTKRRATGARSIGRRAS